MRFSRDIIYFERVKTSRAMRSNPIIISIANHDEMKLIMNKWGNWNNEKENYLFPVLEAGLTSP